MSRTYKDRPARIQANDPRNRKNSHEYHHCGPRWKLVRYKSITTKKLYSEGFYEKKIPISWATEWKECTLHEDVNHGGRWTYLNCHYLPLTRTDWDWSYSKFTQDARDYFNSIQRSERREKTKKMVDEYNACGIIEDDIVFDSFKKKGHWY